MELKLDIYKTKLCKKGDIVKTCTIEEFELSTGICEEVLNIINIDMFENGFSTLSKESMEQLAISVLKNGFPFFKDIFKEMFEITDEEIAKTRIADLAKIVINIVKYSFSQLKPVSTNNGKN